MSSLTSTTSRVQEVEYIAMFTEGIEHRPILLSTCDGTVHAKKIYTCSVDPTITERELRELVHPTIMENPDLVSKLEKGQAKIACILVKHVKIQNGFKDTYNTFILY